MSNTQKVKVRLLVSLYNGGTAIKAGSIISLPAEQAERLAKLAAVELIKDEKPGQDDNGSDNKADPFDIFEAFLKDEQKKVLISAGFDTIPKIAEAQHSELVALSTIGDATAKNLLEVANK